MTHQSSSEIVTAAADPCRQVTQLRELLALVRNIAGHVPNAAERESALDEAALVISAYARALPVVQRRFDTLAAETAGWAAAGVEALLAAGDEVPPRAAADRLADQLGRALSEMAALLD